MISTCAIASISAVSVPGRIGIHSAGTSSGMSVRSGETLTSRTPAATARRSHSPISCTPPPPFWICPLRSAMPPKHTINFVPAQIARQSVTGPTTQAESPMTCGSNTCAAPCEYEVSDVVNPPVAASMRCTWVFA